MRSTRVTTAAALLTLAVGCELLPLPAPRDDGAGGAATSAAPSSSAASGGGSSTSAGASSNVASNSVSAATSSSASAGGAGGSPPCQSASDCDASEYCEGGVCLAKLALAASCKTAGSCLSGNCVEGNCCDSPCTGGCYGCALPFHAGNCTPYEKNTDPKKQCAIGEVCDGLGACASSPFNACGVKHDGLGPSLLLDTGTAGAVKVARDGNRIVTVDSSTNRWMLWDAMTAREVARGAAGRPWIAPSLRGGLMLVAVADGFDLRDSSTGALIAPLAGAQADVAKDGSYAWTADATALTVWSTAGAKVCARIGDYATASIYAAPAELRVGNGPIGGKVEIVAVPGCAATVVSYTGGFKTWFGDGSHFVSGFDSNLWVYTSGGKFAGSASGMGAVGGSGDHLVVASGGKLLVYTLGDLNPTPAFGGSYLTGFTVRNGVVAAVNDSDNTLYWAELVGYTEHQQPLIHRAAVDNFDADAQGRWAVGGTWEKSYGGVTYYGTVADPQASGVLGCGRPLYVAGSPAGRVVVSTATGGIKVFSVTAGKWKLEGALAKPLVGSMALDPTGAVLATVGGIGGGPLRLFMLPDGTDLGDWDKTFDSGAGLMLSAGGHLSGSWSSGRRVTNVADKSYLYQDKSSGPPPKQSPGGKWFAISDVLPQGSKCPSTVVYAGAMPIGILDGYAVGWLTDDRLLVQRYKYNPYQFVCKLDESVVYDSSLQVVAKPQLFVNYPYLNELRGLSANLFYAPETGAVYDAITGSTVAVFGAYGAPAANWIVYQGPAAVKLGKWAP